MRGAHYVVIALLVAASERTAAESNQTKPLRIPDNEFLASSGTIDDTLPLYKSRDPHDDLTSSEVRMPLGPQASLGKAKRSFTEAANSMKNELDDVIARAAKAIKDHEIWIQMLEASKRQRIDLTPVVTHEVHAPPKSDDSVVLVASNVASVLTGRVKGEAQVAIIENAARAIMKHDFRPVSPGPSTSSVASSGIELNDQLIAKKALEFGVYGHPDEVKFSAEHYLRLRKNNDQSAHPAAIYGRSVFKDWMDDIAQGPVLRAPVQVDKGIVPIHAAFLKAFNLPFHQYPQETVKMMMIVRKDVNASPSNSNTFKTLKALANKQKVEDLTRLLNPDVKNLLSDGEEMLETNEENLREAYTVKLVIMYDLFYEFCHSREKLFYDLPPRVGRFDWILMLPATKDGSIKHQLPLPHD